MGQLCNVMLADDVQSTSTFPVLETLSLTVPDDGASSAAAGVPSTSPPDPLMSAFGVNLHSLHAHTQKGTLSLF